jgi:hypothetical protein
VNSGHETQRLTLLPADFTHGIAREAGHPNTVPIVEDGIRLPLNWNPLRDCTALSTQPGHIVASRVRGPDAGAIERNPKGKVSNQEGALDFGVARSKGNHSVITAGITIASGDPNLRAIESKTVGLRSDLLLS